MKGKAITKPTKAWGVAGFILSLLGLLFWLMPYFGIVFSILAIIFYAKQKKIELTGLATAGRIMGIIGIVMNGIILIIVFLVLGTTMFGVINPATTNGASHSTCVPNWQCSSWSECSSFGTQIRTCTDLNNCGILKDKPTESQSCTPQKQKVKSATLDIDRVQIQVANLYPTRVTVTNTGDVSISPKFDLYVYDHNDKEVCAGSPLFDEIRTLSSGEKQTGEISIMGCMFEKDGAYTLKVDLLDSDYTKLDTATKDFTVDYWSKF